MEQAEAGEQASPCGIIGSSGRLSPRALFRTGRRTLCIQVCASRIALLPCKATRQDSPIAERRQALRTRRWARLVLGGHRRMRAAAVLLLCLAACACARATTDPQWPGPDNWQDLPDAQYQARAAATPGDADV